MNIGKGMTTTIIALNSVNSAILFLFAIPAFIIGKTYVSDSYISFGFEMAPCCLGLVAGTLVILVMSIISIIMSALIARAIRTPWAYRALYIMFLYPIVLISFIIANFWNELLTAFILGFPLFLIGGFLMPFAALSLHRTTMNALKTDRVMVICPMCKEQVSTPRFNTTFQCTKCHWFYQNPVAHLKQVEAGEAAQAQPPEPKKKIHKVRK